MLGGRNPFYLLQTIWRGRNAPLALLVVFLGSFIWWIGPKLPYPFNNVVVRGFLIMGITALVAGITSWRRRRKRRDADELIEEVAKPDESEILKSRFKAATKTLRQAEKSGRKGLMDLPWYIIIGPPGSGKTTLLRNAGLNFPIEDGDMAAAVKGVGGTRDCDWWFADEAVLLDTAGRYTTQDSSEEVDRKSWATFLDLLRSRRRKRPINGIFVGIGADILLTASEDEISRHAGLIRKRILELYTKLGGRFPVYLMVTKIDLVPGFTEFFGNLTANERDQVWGYTQQVIKSEGDVARVDANFDGEFELLLSRVSRQVLDRVREEVEPKRRSLILSFPEQLARARSRLRLLVTEGFAPNSYQEDLLLRGVYLTSGTQEGAPIDRMMGGLARAMKVDPIAVRQTPPTGRAYFIKDLLRRVVFPEQDLLGIGFREAQKRRRLQLIAYGAVASILGLALIGWTYVYVQEREYVDVAEAALQDYRDEMRDVPPLGDAFDAQLRDATVRLDKIAEARQRIADADPAPTTFGLPGDNALVETVDETYHDQLDKSLAPIVETSLANRLQRRDDIVQDVTAFSPFEVNLLSTFVRAYGALESPRERLDSEEARKDFIDTVSYDLYLRDPALAQPLFDHLRAWVEQPRGPRPRAVNPAVLEGARQSLSVEADGLGPARSAYNDWLFRALRDSSAPDAERERGARPGIVDRVGTVANDVFRRRSGRPLNEPIPVVFTKTGFETFFESDLDDIVDTVERDDWVYLEGGRSFDKTDARKAITDAYVADYIRFWRDFTADIAIRRADRGDVLRQLSRNPSPLRELFGIVVSNTQLYVDEGSQSQGRRIAGIQIGGAPRRQPTDTPEQRVTEAFGDVSKLFGSLGEDGTRAPGKIDEVVAEIRTLANEIAAARSGDTAMAVGDTLQARRNLETLARDLEASGTGLDLFLREVLGTADEQRTEGEISQIEARYRQRILPICRQRVAGRYPFVLDYNRRSGLRDLEELFGSNGEFTRFIAEELDPFIDRSRGGWTWKSEYAELVENPGNLRQFERAERIRRAMFSRGEAGFTFDVTPLEMGESTERFRLELGDQEVDFYGQRPRTTRDVRWPFGQVLISMESGNRSSVVAPEGDWGLFRLLDTASNIRSTNGGTSARVTFSDADQSATLRFDMDSVDNPISTFGDWRRFRCPSEVW